MAVAARGKGGGRKDEEQKERRNAVQPLPSIGQIIQQPETEILYVIDGLERFFVLVATPFIHSRSTFAAYKRS